MQLTSLIFDKQKLTHCLLNFSCTKKKIVTLLFFAFLPFSCTIKPSATFIIDIQPFADIDTQYIHQVQQALSTIYKHVELKKPIPLPASAFYAPRHRYRADSLIRYLKSITPENHICIGITNKDISHTKDKINDYGIMGLGYLSGASCVVSTFRLPKAKVIQHLIKLSEHELGHTQGLPHCADTHCLMRDANGKNHFDEQKGFCNNCKAHLINKGWVIP